MSSAERSALEEIAERLEGLQRRAEAAGLLRLAAIVRSAWLEAEKARARPPS